MAASSRPDRRGRQDDGMDDTEQTPLMLGHSSPDDSHVHSQGSVDPKAWKPTSTIIVLCMLVFTVSASTGFMNMSMTRIFEDILCRRYYGEISSRDEPIEESMCKVDAIQSELAYLFATMAAANAGVSVLTALPWGIAADRIGRRPVFALSLLGLSGSVLWIMAVGWFPQILSPRLIWLSPISYLLGGGNPVASAAVASIATDIVPASERSVTFLRIHGASQMGNLISPALASLVMASTGPWLPFFISFLLIALPAPAIFLVPETLSHISHEEDAEDDDDDSEPDSKTRLSQAVNELRISAKIFDSPSMILILLITMMQLVLIQCTYQFLSQFVSKRYEIPLAETGYIQSVYGIAFTTVSFVLMPVVLPLLTKSCTPSFLRFSDNKRRDLFVVRGSYLVSMIGTLILALSPSLSGFVFGLIVLAFGTAGEGFLKNIATLYVNAEQRTRLFTILSLAMIAGDLWVSPVLAKLFSLGMRLGDGWIGLPYLGVSVACVVMFSMALGLRLPGTSHVDSEEGRGSE